MNQQMSVGAERDASSDGRARPSPLSMPATDRSRPAPVPALDPGGAYLQATVVDAHGMHATRRPDDIAGQRREPPTDWRGRQRGPLRRVAASAPLAGAVEAQRMAAPPEVDFGV